MTVTDYSLSLLGRPWLSGARGPDAFDCWGLLVEVYRKGGIALPLYPNIDAKNTLAVARKVSEGVSEWTQLAEPEHLCAVGLSAGRHIHHVGLWLATEGGGVLHSASGRGVTFQSIMSLRGIGLTNLTFYRHGNSIPLL